MGRSGGGGGRSSGGFGGHRSSGGFSGRGRSSGGFSSRSSSYGSSFRRASYHSRPRYGGFGPIHYGPRLYHETSLSSLIVSIILIIIIISVMSSMIEGTGQAKKIVNTTQRQKLVGVVNKTDWYEDKIGWVSSRNTLITGLEDFYNKTGLMQEANLLRYSSSHQQSVFSW